MKKTILFVAVALAFVAVLGAVSYAFAQTPSPRNPFPGMGGMMGPGNYGPMHGGGMMGSGNYGPMHDYMVKAMAEELGLTPEQIENRIENGETMWDIARGQGLSDDEIAGLMQNAHNQAIQEAVEAGAITQEQADWMNNHMQQMHGADGTGGCHGGGSTPTSDSNL